jgi:hypothetical protein
VVAVVPADGICVWLAGGVGSVSEDGRFTPFTPLASYQVNVLGDREVLNSHAEVVNAD